MLSMYAPYSNTPWVLAMPRLYRYIHGCSLWIRGLNRTLPWKPEPFSRMRWDDRREHACTCHPTHLSQPSIWNKTIENSESQPVWLAAGPRVLTIFDNVKSMRLMVLVVELWSGTMLENIGWLLFIHGHWRCWTMLPEEYFIYIYCTPHSAGCNYFPDWNLCSWGVVLQKVRLLEFMHSPH